MQPRRRLGQSSIRLEAVAKHRAELVYLCNDRRSSSLWQGGCSANEAMRQLLALLLLFWAAAVAVWAGPPLTGFASWYGEDHRGKTMANGQSFDPDKLTAASWAYPLGAKVRVTAAGSTNSVEVTITDRGPARELARRGRIIDLSRAAFERLADRDLGVIAVIIQD